MPHLLYEGPKPIVKTYVVTQFVRVEPYQCLVLLNLTELLRKAKKTNDVMDVAVVNLTWRCIKKNKPALAQLLSDPFLAEMNRVFDAPICIEIE